MEPITARFTAKETEAQKQQYTQWGSPSSRGVEPGVLTTTTSYSLMAVLGKLPQAALGGSVLPAHSAPLLPLGVALGKLHPCALVCSSVKLI